MLASYFSPLAPVVVLLLSAFVLSIVTPRLPKSWQAHWLVSYALAPGLVVAAGLVLLVTESSGRELLSGWHFGTAESGTGLNMGFGPTSLPFALLTIIILLVAMLISLPLDAAGGRGWTLTLGASAVLLFAATNQLMLAYTILLLDILLAYHWLVHKQTNLAVARLFLGISTAGILMLTAASTGLGSSTGTFLLGLTLWLRLGLYPFFEIQAAEKQTQSYNFLVYWSFSLAAGIYLLVQTLTTALPEPLRWLVAITMLLNGLLLWLFPANPAEHPTILTRLIFTQALLPLLLISSLADINTAFALGLTLSLAALWTTPQPGRITINNFAKFWPYIAGITATITLMGLPLLPTWPMWATFYPVNFSTDIVKTIVVMVAVMLAMSGLTRYWLNLWYGENPANRQSRLFPAIAAIVAAVPFLIPGLAPLILSSIMPADTLSPGPNEITYTLVLITITTLGAIGLGYFRTQLISRFNIPAETLINIFNLQWLLTWTEKVLSQTGKFVLRVNVILEGQHYIGWALFTALVGSLIIILTRT